MKREPKTLNVGDKLYAKGNYGGITGVYTIERVTPTQAISKNLRFKRTGIYSFDLLGQTSWTSTRYYLETPQLKKDLERQQLISTLEGTKFAKLPTNVLKQLIDVLNVQECDASKATSGN